MNRFLFLILVLAITSCSSNETSDSKNVKQSQIYQIYHIYWIKGEGSASASFRFGGENGTTLRLSDPSKITFNGKKLSESKFLFEGVYYAGVQTVYSDKHFFKFTDLDGKVYENGIEFKDVEILNPPKSVSKNENLVLELTRPILASEEIVCHAQSDTTKTNEMGVGNSSDKDVYFDLKSNRLIIKPGFFADFADVPVDIWLTNDVYQKPIEQKTDLEGELIFSFQSKDIQVIRLNVKAGK